MTLSGTNVYQYQPGLFNANSYLSSGIPYLTGSALSTADFAASNSQVKVSFPYVTRAVTVINTSGSIIRAHFNAITGANVIAGRHYTSISGANASVTYNVKCREIYISLANSTYNSDFEVIAELTTINSQEMFQLTGSGLSV